MTANADPKEMVFTLTEPSTSSRASEWRPTIRRVRYLLASAVEAELAEARAEIERLTAELDEAMEIIQGIAWSPDTESELHDTRYLGKDFREREVTQRRLSRIKARLERLPAVERNAIRRWLEMSKEGTDASRSMV